MIAEPGAPGNGVAVQAWRIMRAGVHLLRGAVVLCCVFPLISAERRRDRIRLWSRQLLALLAVRLHVHGALPPRSGAPLIILANHVSWLDIYLIDAILPVRFVAKSEVRRWPLIGWMAERVGTLFIRRAWRADTLRINGLVANAMRQGDPFAIFPEATTTDGTTVLKFHSSLLQPALVAGAAIHPVALRYARPDGSPCLEAAYDGDKSVWDTLRLMATQRVIHAHVTFLAPMTAAGRHRRDLAVAAREAITRGLASGPPRSRIETAAGRRVAAR